MLANARKADENVRRRAMIGTIGKSTLLGGVGLGLLCFGASFLVQPKIVEVPKVVEIPEPRVIETTKVVETPKIIEITKLVEGPARVKGRDGTAGAAAAVCSGDAQPRDGNACVG